MKVSIRTLTLAAALLALAAVPGRANTITPQATAFAPGISITYSADLTSGEIHVGDGFTIFDIGGFIGFGVINPLWDASSSNFGSPFSPPSSLGPDTFDVNVHFTYKGPPDEFEVAFGVFTYTPFVVLTSSTTITTDDWLSRDHELGTVGVIGDGALGEPHRDTIVVPAHVPDGGSTAALLGSVLVAFGVLRRRYS